MYTIGKLARRARVNTDSVRFYERQGLVVPARRTGSGYRLYTDDALQRITFIRHAQRCGFSLAEIGELLQVRNSDPDPCSGGYRLAVEKKAEIEKTIAALHAMSEALSCLLTPNAPANPVRPESAESPLLAALARSSSKSRPEELRMR